MKLLPPRGEYKYFTAVGNTEIYSPQPIEIDHRFRFRESLLDCVPSALRGDLEEKAGEFYRARGSVPSVAISIGKMDQPISKRYKHHPMWRKAKDYVFRKLATVWEGIGLSSTEEVMTTYNFKTSSGIPWSQRGYKTKGDCFKSEEFLDYVSSPSVCDCDPIWRVSPKEEWKDAMDIDNGKVRTFIIPPLHLLHHQKMLFLKQNNAIKRWWWSAYGFNPYSGGVNHMAHRLMTAFKKTVFFMYDVKGWDRLMPIMKTVYKLRSQFHEKSETRLYRWVVRNTIASYLNLPNGDVIWKDWGNNSGSGDTTVDNIIAHMLILTMCLLVLSDGSEEFVDLVPAFLYGDDDAGALDEFFSNDVERVFRDVFGLFGLELDPFLVTKDLGEIEFCGFFFKNITPWGWVPQYKVSRLLAAFCFEYERGLTEAERLSKLVTLTYMASATTTGEFEWMRQALGYVLYSLRDDENGTIKAYVNAGVPSLQLCLTFLSGKEGGIKMNEMSSVSRSDFIFDKLSSRSGVTEAGKEFLRMNLDPMHDAPIRPHGWPDLVSTPSVVRCIKQSLAIAKPDSVVTPTWDCHVIFWPWLQNLPFNLLQRVNNYTYGVPLSDAAPLGGITTFGISGGSNLSISTSLSSGALFVDPSFTEGASRVIGMGMEVVNTTAEIYKQGTVTVWRQQESAQSIGTMTEYVITSLDKKRDREAITATVVSLFDAAWIRSPPINIAQAMLYPGSRQFRAAEGGYMIGTYTDPENPPTFVAYTMPVIPNNAVDDLEYANVNSGNVFVPTIQSATPVACLPAVRILPMNQQGMIFTGLSAQTTLTLTWNVFLETFPSIAEEQILVLAEPSAMYDPIALELLSQIVGELPVGVPSTWNPEGEWWKEVVGTLGDLISGAVGAFIPSLGPVANAINTGVKKSAGIGPTNNFRTPPAPMSKPKLLSAPKKPQPVRKVVSDAQRLKKRERRKRAKARKRGVKSII